MKWQGRRGSRNIEDRRRCDGTTGVAGIGGGAAIVIVIVGYFLGVDVSVLRNGQSTEIGASDETPLTKADQRAAEFVWVTLADTEELWAEISRTQLAKTVQPATLLLFKGTTQSPCGGTSGAAYVVAHEVAHHVQNELGEADRVRSEVSEVESNQISIRIELQADCFSGTWARRAHEPFGSLERAASPRR